MKSVKVLFSFVLLFCLLTSCSLTPSVPGQTAEPAGTEEEEIVFTAEMFRAFEKDRPEESGSSPVTRPEEEQMPEEEQFPEPEEIEEIIEEIIPSTTDDEITEDILPDTEPEETLPFDDNEPAVPDEENNKFDGVSISFAAVGDNLIHQNIYLDAQKRGTAEKEYDFLPMYSDVSGIIAAADIAFINQETVMAGADYGYSSYPCFNCPQQLGLDMVRIGFDVINIANNHMLDKQAGGLEDTIKFWNEQPVTLVGGYLNEEDYSNIRITEKDGVKFGWLAYTLATNGIVKNASSDVVIPYIDDDLILSDLARAEEVCDFTIVSIHWGNENTQTPTDEQYRLAKLIAENGGDLILGHHSHTLQPIEWIETERGRVLCVYSLGNFVSGMAAPINMVSEILTFNIKGSGNKLEVTDVIAIPTVFYYGPDWYNTHVYLLDDYTPEIAATHGVCISGYSLSHDKAAGYVSVIDDEFLG